MPIDADRPGSRVVLLNGPPSCGKTTVARALQRTLAEPWFHRSLDDFRAGYLDEHWRSDDGTLFDRVVAGYLPSLRALALAGNSLIAEAVITPTRVGIYVETFRDLDVTLIGIRCPLEVAVERERARTDRLNGPIELPADAFAAVHAGMGYDLDIDTSTSTAEVIADAIVSYIHEATPTAFARLVERSFDQSSHAPS